MVYRDEQPGLQFNFISKRLKCLAGPYLLVIILLGEYWLETQAYLSE